MFYIKCIILIKIYNYKKILFFFGMLLMGLSGISQNNQSNGFISTSIFSPPSTTGEAFRFRPGIVTQLDQGSFGFTANDRWWSLGRLNTGSQTVFGLRLQNGEKALTLGYNDISNNNPRIQWIGANGNLGNLEFRTATSFTSTNSTLVTTMRSDGTTVFGNSNTGIFPNFQDTKVGVGNGSFGNGGGEFYVLEVNTYGNINVNSPFPNYYGGSFYAGAGGAGSINPGINLTGLLGRTGGGNMTNVSIGVSGIVGDNAVTSYSI